MSTPTECTIEEILGMDLAKMKTLTAQQWEEYLRPHIAKQEQIFVEIKAHKPKSITTVSPGGKRIESLAEASARQAKVPTGGMASLIANQKLSPQEAALRMMMDSGVKLTPDMLEALKNAK